MRKAVSAAVFAMPLRGHFMRLRPLIAELARAGVRTDVFTDACFRDEVERLGGRFIDLFAGRAIDSIDPTSIPMPCRLVSFAGRYGDDVVRDVAALRPSLVVHDTFAVIGPVVANHLGIPRVNVCAGHNLVPARILEALHRDVPVSISDACWAAVATLRERHGMPEATPFSYFTVASPDLNLYCEPPEFLRPGERDPFEPIAFFGSLASEDVARRGTPVSLFGADSGSKLRIYASFGTITWRYFEAEALAVLEALSDSLACREDAVALVSLGGRDVTGRAARLVRPNVRVERYVDQGEVLREASICLTHQGLNSTHEAIYHGVPMISYPFFWDQPDLAARCQELGLAVPLADTVRGRVDPDDVRAALARVVDQRESMRARLAEARRWEIESIRLRPDVIRRMLKLVP